MSLRSAPAVLIAAFALVAGGCGGSGDSANSGHGPAADTSTVAPATGVLISTDVFTYRAPRGWEKPPAGSSYTDADAAAISLHGESAGDNVNVTRAGNAPNETFSDVEKELQVELPDQVNLEGSAEIEDNKINVMPRRKIDREEAVHVAYTTYKAPTTVSTEQYYVSHRRRLYIVTFSFVTGLSQAERDEISESVLNSWNWVN